MKNKNAELFLSGLSQLQPLVEKVENLEKAYKASQKRALSEDIFWSEDRNEIYKSLRELEASSSDYIKGLKKELQELMILASTVSMGYSSLNDKEEK